MFLTNISMWWYNKHPNMERGTYTIHTWEDFKKPQNVENFACKEPKVAQAHGVFVWLCQGIINPNTWDPKYIREWLVLQLHEWASKLGRVRHAASGVQDPATAMALMAGVEQFVKFKKTHTSSPNSPIVVIPNMREKRRPALLTTRKTHLRKQGWEIRTWWQEP